MRCASAFAFGVLAMALSAPAAALEIGFEVTSLEMAGPSGGELWRYDYRVDAFPHPAGFGFSIFFDVASTGAIQAPPAVNADWDVLVLQADPGLPDDGLYDALALASEPSVADVFSVVFEWLGPGEPGSQPFVVYDSNMDFATVAEGVTAPVPEPGTLSLALLGGALGLSLGRGGAGLRGGRAGAGRIR